MSPNIKPFVRIEDIGGMTSQSIAALVADSTRTALHRCTEETSNRLKQMDTKLDSHCRKLEALAGNEYDKGSFARLEDTVNNFITEQRTANKEAKESYIRAEVDRDKIATDLATARDKITTDLATTTARLDRIESISVDVATKVKLVDWCLIHIKSSKGAVFTGVGIVWVAFRQWTHNNPAAWQAVVDGLQKGLGLK